MVSSGSFLLINLRQPVRGLNEITMGYDYDEASDPTGPFNMCVISEYLATDKNMNYTRGDILFCSAGMISDSVLEASNFLNGQVRFGQQMPCFADPKFL